MERELELFDTRIDRVPDTVESPDSGEAMILETDEEVATIPIPHRTIATKNDTPVQPTVSRDIRSNNISPELRQETVKEILVILNPLNAQSPPPDLLPRAAKHLEHKTFQKLSNERSVNALGRSSTLLTAGKPSNLAAKYTKAKEKILQKVKQYVQTATSEDVDLENIQQGEIWEVFREVLDDKDL
jgi:hypothetical protein